jgi:capsular exopolysaccharide synthesis family protein
MMYPEVPSNPSSDHLRLSAGSGGHEPSAFSGLPENGARQYLDLVRRYAGLGVALAILGAAAGVAVVVISTPIYRSRILLEVQGINESWLKNSFEVSSTYDSNQVNLQTQIKLLQNGPFLSRVYERLQAETVPVAPAQTDIFAALRRRVRSEVRDPMAVLKDGLETAFESFDARPVNGTRLLELSCDSTSPQVAAQFVNTIASEFIDETMRSRTVIGQRTNEWLSSQIEEIRIKLQEAEGRLQTFVRSSGNLFAGQENTLDDTKLKQLQAELADVQADRIKKQARHETAVRSSAENLGDVLEDSALRNYERQISDLRREKASLEITLLPAHSKVQKVSAQIAAAETALRNEKAAVLARVKNEYESAMGRERLLTAAYAGQSQRVSTISGKSAEHSALKREVEGLRQMYQALLLQANQTSLSNSVPVTPIRLVAPALPPVKPYRPKPVLNISFGAVLGLVFTAGIAIARRSLDRTVATPVMTRQLLQVPQLGVIPSASLARFPRLRQLRLENKIKRGTSTLMERPEGAMTTTAPSHMAESFRTTLTSILGAIAGETARVVLVTSPGPAEGKTVVATNLALALAEAGKKVLLVDADFRRPRLHRVFDLPNATALVDLIDCQDESPEAVMAAVAPSGYERVSVLVNRAECDRVPKILYSPRLAAILQVARANFDYIVLDTPPLLHLADTRLLARSADGVVLVLRAGATDRESAIEACQNLQSNKSVLLGTILNDWNPGRAHVKKNYYYYSQK